MEIKISKVINKVLLIEERKNSYKDNALEKVIYFEEESIHPKTKTQQVQVQTLKLDDSMKSKIEVGKKYLVELKQTFYKGDTFLKITESTEIK